MLGKKVTIFVLPLEKHQVGKVRELSMPRYLPAAVIFLLLLLAACSVAFGVWNHYRYLEAVGYESEAIMLREKAALQSVQIYAFADRLRLLEREMGQLRQFDLKLRAMTGTMPEELNISAQALGGFEPESQEPVVDLHAASDQMIRQMHQDLDRLLAETSVLELGRQIAAKFFEDSKSIQASTPDAWPLTGPITSTFGYRTSPFGSSTQFHRGLDISAPNGTPIVAPADGMVVSVDWNSGYGNILVINHGYRLITRYAHLSQTFVSEGEPVVRGQKIAAVGSTGRVTGPHLHYECILNGIPVNPMNYMAAQQ